MFPRSLASSRRSSAVPYTYEWPRPGLTTDVALFHIGPAQVELLLIQRKNDPYQGLWALPGGFLEEGEVLDDCARRELKEETGITVREVHPLANFSTPGRDPRGWTVTAAYIALTRQTLEPQGADDAAEARWFPLGDLPALAFDHDEIVARALMWLHTHAQERGIDPDMLPPVLLAAR